MFSGATGLVSSSVTLYVEIVALAVGVLASILIHEVGHLLAGRCAGLNATKVSIGFGPVLISGSDRKGTLWNLTVLPFGGACQFKAIQDNRRNKIVDDDGTCALPHGARIMIYGAGPALNIGFAALIFGLVWIALGRVELDPFRVESPGLGVPLLVALFSLSLGLFNLLPIPPLDGGYILLSLFEAISKRSVDSAAESQFRLFGTIVLTISSAVALGLLMVNSL